MGPAFLTLEPPVHAVYHPVPIVMGPGDTT